MNLKGIKEHKKIVWMLLSLGVIIRTIQYLFNRSLWHDEAKLALNIAEKSFSGLLEISDSLLYAPSGFLITEKFLTQIFGNTEYALRLFPFFCGIISIFLFYAVAAKFIKPRATLVALGLFVISRPHIFQTINAKPYTADIAFALLIFWISAFMMKRHLTPLLILAYGLAGAIAVWFSNSALFILLGAGGTLAIFNLIKKEKTRFWKLAASYSIWITSFLFYYFISVKPFLFSNSYESMVEVHKHAFIPFPLLSINDVLWAVNIFFEVFRCPGGLVLTGLVAFAFFIGCFSFYKEKREVFFLLLSPLAFLLLASGLHIYPLYNSLLLFIVPSLFLCIAEGVGQIMQRTKKEWNFIQVILLILIFFFPVLSSSSLLFKPLKLEEIKKVLSYVQEHRKRKETIYVYHGARPAFQYYARKCGLKKRNYILGKKSKGDLQEYTKQLDRLSDQLRVWFLFSNADSRQGLNEENFFLYYLNLLGEQIDKIKASGVSAYLYEYEAKEMREGEIGVYTLRPSHPDILDTGQISMKKEGFVRSKFYKWKKGRFELNVLARGTAVRNIWPRLGLRFLEFKEGQMETFPFKYDMKISLGEFSWHKFIFDLDVDIPLALKLVHVNARLDPIEKKRRHIYIKRINLEYLGQ